MTQEEIKNEIINKVISPLIVATLKQSKSEKLFKEGKIKEEEVETPLQDIFDSFDTNRIKEVNSCIEWYEGHMKSIIDYMQTPLKKVLNKLPEDEYTGEVDSELISASYVIKPSTSYNSNTSSQTPLDIKKRYAISDEVMPTKINATQIAKAIKIGETSVMDAINAGDIIVETTFKRSLTGIKIKETNESNE